MRHNCVEQADNSTTYPGYQDIRDEDMPLLEDIVRVLECIPDQV
jgi:hypothetical protein